MGGVIWAGGVEPVHPRVARGDERDTRLSPGTRYVKVVADSHRVGLRSPVYPHVSSIFICIMTGLNRRTFVKVVAAGTITSAVAGCTGSGTQGGGNGDGSGDVPPAIDSYLSGANEYDGSITDMTGQESVAIDVGGGGDQGLAFTPPSVLVDVGTTVTWEWTGKGNMHNVVAEDDSFTSEYHSDAGETFEHTFETTGDYTYYCEPHKSTGMKGGIAVR